MRAVVLALVVLVAQSHAGEEERLQRARARFEAGRALYSLGEYDQALREFAAGYQLVPKAEFLINLGQTYRKLERYGKAREMYEKFLKEARPDDPNRAAVKMLLDEVDREEPHATAPPPATAPSPAPVVTAPPAAPTPSATTLTASAPPAKKRFDKRHLGWIIPLAAAVIAAGAVGIYFGVRPGDGCQSGLPCVDSTHH